MVFTIETGAGTPGANAYIAPEFVTTHLADRGRETEQQWSTRTTDEQQDAIVKASSYADLRYGCLLRGVKLRTNIDGRKASSTMAFAGQPADAETVTIGQKDYRFVAALAQENDILIGATLADTLLSAARAVAGIVANSDVGAATLVNYEAMAQVTETEDGLLVTAIAEGSSGNLIEIATTSAQITVSAATLEGGLDGGEQPLEMPRDCLYSDSGVRQSGIPLWWKQVVAELAPRTFAGDLLPDPTTNSSTGAAIVEQTKKLDVLSKTTRYAEGGATSSFVKSFPVADQLVKPFLVSGACVIH